MHTDIPEAEPMRAGTAAAPAPGPRPTSGPPRAGRALLRRPVVAAVVAAAALAGAGVAAANDWLPIFATERVTPLPVDATDLFALPDLDALGDVEVTGDPDVHPVADAAAAAAATGLDVPEVGELPRGVGGEPTYLVGGEAAATATFSSDRGAPAELDGARVRLVAGPGVAVTWSRPGGPPSLVVARAVAPSASASGATLEAVRDHLLSLPDLPDGLAAQLEVLTGDGATLPLPVPTEHVTTSAAAVDGIPATVVATRDRALAAVVWVADGEVTVVAGSLDVDEVLSVARGLR